MFFNLSLVAIKFYIKYYIKARGQKKNWIKTDSILIWVPLYSVIPNHSTSLTGTTYHTYICVSNLSAIVIGAQCSIGLLSDYLEPRCICKIGPKIKSYLKFNLQSMYRGWKMTNTVLEDFHLVFRQFSLILHPISKLNRTSRAIHKIHIIWV